MKNILFVMFALITTSSAYASNIFTVCFSDIKPNKIYTGRIVMNTDSASIDYMGDDGSWSGLTATITGREINALPTGYRVSGLTMHGPNGYTITNMNFEVTPDVVKLWQNNDAPKVHALIPCP
ncbi:MAG: hypothetical protein JSU04_07370 [Bdellovibrionales bacterium]|nr:hypothetical protein [Bdellovibrionales bacterium]